MRLSASPKRDRVRVGQIASESSLDMATPGLPQLVTIVPNCEKEDPWWRKGHIGAVLAFASEGC